MAQHYGNLITCDHDGCQARVLLTEPEGSGFVAADIIARTEDEALSAGWVLMQGGRDYCTEHREDSKTLRAP
jgi:proline racemase